MAKQAALDTTELLKTYKRYKGTWNCSNKLEDFGREQPEGHVARLLWTARHNGDLTMEDANFLLHIFPGAPDMWQAEDLIELVKELQKYCPDGEYSGGGASGWCDTDLPGSAYGLGGLIEEKKGDKAFAKHMKAHWKDLPTFWGTGVAFFLVLHDHMSYKELSDELVDTFLKAYIGSSGSWQARQFAEKLPDKVYKEALKRVLDNDPLLQLNYSEFADTISRFVKYYKPEEVIVLLDHVPNTNYIHDGVKALFPLGKKGIEFFEASFEGLEVPEQDWSKPWPYGFKITAYLALCAEEGHTPPASLDQTIQAMMGIYNGPWEGHDEDCEMTKKAFSSIPEDRLEAILLGMSPFPWKWIWLSSTPAIIEATFGAFCGLRAKVDYELERVVACLTGTGWASASQRALFAPIVEGLKPLFFEALKKGTKAGQRTNMMKLLAEEKDPAYIEAFIKGLNDTSKATRELAVGAMVSYGAETVREHIEAPLSAKRKDTRLAAALVLAHLPADEAVYELAQTYLKKEKTAEVKAMLETVAVPGERGEVSIDPKISEALEESVGAAWEEFKELGGDELVEVYWGWLANRSEGDSISPYSDSYTHWLALLKEYHEAASAPEAAIKVMTCLEYYNIDDYLKEIRPLFGARLDDSLAQIVRKGKVIRPPEAGGGETVSFKSFLEKLAYEVYHEPPYLSSALVEVLDDRRSTIRKIALEAFRGKEFASSALLAGLGHDRPKVRAACAELLGGFSGKEVLKALEEARESEEDKATIAALDASIAMLKSATLDLSPIARDKKGEAKLNKILGALPLASQPSGLNKLPELEWENGTKVSKKAKAWIISTLRMENMETRSEIWPEVRERLDDESCYALADTWVEDTPKEARWGVSGRYTGNMLFVQCMLGKPEHIRDILANLDTLASSQSTQWGSEGVEALTRDGSDLAIRGLDRASKKSRRQALKWRAASGLNTLARRRDMTLEELLDSAVSDFGFDASGEQVLDYGPRTITVRLGPSNELVIIDEKGKTLKSMPKARKSDDAALVDVARKHVSSIKKQIKEIHISQLRRLDDALSSQREWPVAAWEKRFLHHPLMHAFSRQLIWEALGPDQKEVAAFLVTEEGEPVDVEAEAIELPQGGSIRLLHPVSLKKKQSDAWKEMFADLELTQPIPQLERRVYKAKELPKKDKDLFQSFPMCTAGQFMGRLDKFGFERGPREDAGAITSSYKTYGPYSITLGHSWYMPELPGEDNMEIEGISASKDGDAVAWRKLPPIILSELVRDLHLLMGG